MKIDQYLHTANLTASALARKLNITPAMIYQWRVGLRPVPVRKCAEIERITNGAVTRKDLRPDDWHLIWPELKERSNAVA